MLSVMWWKSPTEPMCDSRQSPGIFRELLYGAAEIGAAQENSDQSSTPLDVQTFLLFCLLPLQPLLGEKRTGSGVESRAVLRSAVTPYGESRISTGTGVDQSILEATSMASLKIEF